MSSGCGQQSWGDLHVRVEMSSVSLPYKSSLPCLTQSIWLQRKEAAEEIRAIIDQDNAKYAAELIAEFEKKNKK